MEGGQMADQEATQSEAPPPKIHVGGYKKSDGTKVSDHERSLPGGTKRPGQEKEGGSLLKKPLMTVEEYLEMALRDQGAALKYMADGDPVNQELIEQDAASNQAAQIPENMDPPGLDQFLVDLEDEARRKGLLDVRDVQSIFKHAAEHQYNDSDDPRAWGKGALVPHLQKAGLFDTALMVQSMQYKF